MKSSDITPKIINEIISDYKNPAIKVTEIREKYKLPGSQLTEILQKNNIPLRAPKTSVKTLNNYIRCPKCKRVIPNVKNIKFCCFCAADVRTEGMKCLEKIDKLFALIQYLPAMERDGAQINLLDIEKYIKNTEK